MTDDPHSTTTATGFQTRLKLAKVILVRKTRKLSPPALILFFTVLAVMILFPYTSTVQPFDLPQVGEASTQTVIAPFTFDVLKSADDLEQERSAAMEKVLLVVDFDMNRTKQMRAALQQLRRTTSLLVARRPADSGERPRGLVSVLSESAIRAIGKRPWLIDRAVAQAEVLLDKGVSPLLIVPTKEAIGEMEERYNAKFPNCLIYNKHYVTLRRDSVESTVDQSEIQVREVAFDNAIARLRKDRSFDAEALNTVYEILAAYVHPNLAVDDAETYARTRKAADAVLAISGKVIKETEIVRKHQEVTPAILQKLKSLSNAMNKMESVQEREKIWLGNSGRLLFALIALFFVAFYLWKFQRSLLRNGKHLAALALILVFQVLVIRLCLSLMPKLFEGTGEVSLLCPEYFIPTSAAAVLTAILFGSEISLVCTLFIGSYAGLVFGFNLNLCLFALFSGIVSGLSSRGIRYRWEYFKAIPPVLVICLVCITLWQMASFKMTPLSLFQNFGLACVNVGVSFFLAMILTPLFERFYDIATDMTLVELSDMNHPVLKRLSIEAAGTYNHSVLVGNLAESAAERIGANPLLARVASYYHDIGKIEKSDYFVENALSLDKNRHSKLTPNMSALIILAHVKDGRELAGAYRLPKVIQDVIMQHHGTSAVSFFYEKALELDPHKQVQEQDFRYPGPPPQTRETAIIMLADSVEAASRSLGTSSPKLLRDLVKKIIRDKFMDGQLDQSDLTLRDLDGIVEGFMPILQGMFHSRIEYPSK
jgi:cyclic-di-AMP phosphodiesterase PgpH